MKYSNQSFRKSEKEIYNNRRENNLRIRMRRNLIRISAIVLVFAASVIAVLILSINAVRTNAAVKPGTTYYRSVVIEPGETLWSIAEKYMDDTEYYDTRDFISEVKQINNLGSDNIRSGNHLIIPYVIYE